MHPIVHNLNFDNWGELQNRGTEHIYASIHIIDAPKMMKMRTVS